MFIEQVKSPKVHGVVHVCRDNRGDYFRGLYNNCIICHAYIFDEQNYLNPQDSSCLVYNEFERNPMPNKLWQRIKGVFK